MYSAPVESLSNITQDVQGISGHEYLYIVSDYDIAC